MHQVLEHLYGMKSMGLEPRPSLRTWLLLQGRAWYVAIGCLNHHQMLCSRCSVRAMVGTDPVLLPLLQLRGMSIVKA